MRNVIFTIGHSTHSPEHLVLLLKRHGITAVSDVRSQPYSRINPQFNREALKSLLISAGISYVFLGRELGARSDDPSCYENGRVQYARLAKTELFQIGISRVIAGSQKHRIALMCAEKEPLDCHRTILVSRSLVAADTEVRHIHADGHTESQDEVLDRLMWQLGIRERDMFLSESDLQTKAYEVQEERIAYRPISEEKALDPLIKSIAI
jgi:uncharacterized protein (DUF488 family)